MTILFETARGASVLLSVLLLLRLNSWLWMVYGRWRIDGRAGAVTEFLTPESFTRLDVRAGTLALIMLTMGAFLMPMIGDVLTWLRPTPSNHFGALLAVHMLLVMLSWRWIHFSKQKHMAYSALASVYALSWFIELAQRAHLA